MSSGGVKLAATKTKDQQISFKLVLLFAVEFNPGCFYSWDSFDIQYMQGFQRQHYFFFEHYEQEIPLYNYFSNLALACLWPAGLEIMFLPFINRFEKCLEMGETTFLLFQDTRRNNVFPFKDTFQKCL